MSRVAVTYRVCVRPSEVEAVAEALALEQSVELPAAALHDADVKAHIAGRVTAVRRHGEAIFDVGIEVGTATMGGDVAQIVNMLFGSSWLYCDVGLVCVRFPG